tara:strand:+ start:1089 stop:1472 length:384 start_codon:yes stop_codon:yes gene_type:complete
LAIKILENKVPPDAFPANRAAYDRPVKAPEHLSQIQGMGLDRVVYERTMINARPKIAKRDSKQKFGLFSPVPKLPTMLNRYQVDADIPQKYRHSTLEYYARGLLPTWSCAMQGIDTLIKGGLFSVPA